MISKQDKDKQIKEDIEENLTLNSPTIYGIIAEEGREEMERPFNSLLFSGIVAGLCISFSLFTMGYLSLLTDNKIIIALGYTIGFLIVIKGRLQLFTENTITVILPLLKRPTGRNFYRTGRLWLIVFCANMIGTALTALLVGHGGIATEKQMTAFIEISKYAIDKTPSEVFLTAIPAGFILAAMVWMLPSTQSSKTLVIILMTFVISIGHFSHVVAGSTEAFLLLFENNITLVETMTYIGLAAAGNIIGGTVLFSMLAYGQTYKEL